jgi:hypothetical protein
MNTFSLNVQSNFIGWRYCASLPVLVRSWQPPSCHITMLVWLESSTVSNALQILKHSTHTQSTICACSYKSCDQYDDRHFSAPVSSYFPASQTRMELESLNVRSPSTREGTPPRGLILRNSGECCRSACVHRPSTQCPCRSLRSTYDKV